MAASRRLPANRWLTVDFDVAQCSADLDALLVLLKKPAISERKNVLPFFRRRPHLTAFLGSYDVNIRSYERIAYEFDVFGSFIADAIVGDPASNAYCFIEFEDGKDTSVFRSIRRRTNAWSPRFEQGFSQIVDWFWKLHQQQPTTAILEYFGAPSIIASGLLVVGRDAGVVGIDRVRLDWRRDHVEIDRRKVYCCTFDELERDLRSRLSAYRIAAADE